MKVFTSLLTGALPKGHAPAPETPQALLQKLGLDATTAQSVVAQHEDVLHLALLSPGAPLALQDDGHGHYSVTVDRGMSNQTPELPKGFGDLAITLAAVAPNAALKLVPAALSCRTSIKIMNQLHGVQYRAHEAAAATMRAHTTRTAVDRESTPDSTEASFDSIDTVSSSSEDSSLVESDSEADIDEAITPTADPLADMVPPTLSAQAQAVQEASKTGKVRLAQAIEANNPAELKQVLTLAPYLLNEPLLSGETPLQLAVAKGRTKMVALLLEHTDIDPNKAGADGWTPLCLAAHKGYVNIATKLIGHPAIRVNDALPNKSSAFYIAVAHNHPVIARRLLRAGADIHQAKRGGFTPLHAACSAGHVDTLRWLLKQPQLWQQDGAHKQSKERLALDVLNPRTAHGSTPLHLASANARLAVVQLLLEQEGIDPSLEDLDKDTPLHRAAARGHTDVMTSLLRHPKTHLNAQDPTASPPLFAALLNDQLEAAAWLLERGADIHWKSEDSSILAACVDAKESTARWLLKRPELLQKEGYTQALSDVLNEADDIGSTLLHRAAVTGNTRLVEILLAHGADPDAWDAEGWTALAHAVDEGHLETVKLLFPLRKANVNVILLTGETLLSTALRTGKLAVAQWLLKQGADPRQVNSDSSTAWHAACDGGLTAVRWLQKKLRRSRLPGPDINRRDAKDATVLQRAVRDKAAAMVEVLLKQPGIDVNTPDNKGWPPLHRAVRHGAHATVLDLLGHPNIDIFQKGSEGKNVLHFVAMLPHPMPLISAIRDKLSPDQFRALTEARDAYDCLPVSTAAEHGASDAVLALLRPNIPVTPVTHAPTSFRRGWILEGHDMESRDDLVEVGTQAGIEMHAVGDGDGGQPLTLRKVQQLDIRPGDFVIVRAHSAWSAGRKRLEMGLSKGASVPLVELAKLLYEKGVLKVLFLGCEVNTAVTGLRNRFTRDPMIWHPAQGPSPLEGLDYTMVGRKDVVSKDLNDRAAILWMEDCTAGRPNVQVADGAMFNRSVQPMRTLGWDSTTGTCTITTRHRLKADQLDHLLDAERSLAKAELLLLAACDGRSKEATELLTRHGVGADVRSNDECTPLMLASAFGHPKMVEHLLQHNASVDLVDDGGRSALWLACHEGSPSVTQLLLAAGANPHRKNDHDVSPWDEAKKQGYTNILKLLPPPPLHRPTP